MCILIPYEQEVPIHFVFGEFVQLVAVKTAAEGEVEERAVTSLFQAIGVTDVLLVPAEVGSRPRSLS